MKRPGIIKAETVAAAQALGLKSFRLDDVTREAREAVAVARRQADAILAQARAEAEAIRERARQDSMQVGYEEGFRRGQEEGQAQALAAARNEFAQRQADLVQTCRSLIDAINRDRADWLAVARQDLVELALAIARRVVRQVGQRDREVVLANLEEAVRLVGARTEVTIAVNPVDAEAARLFATSLLELKEQWEHVHIVEESDIAPGGCRVQWGSGSVDATLETQLDRIEAELKGE